LIDFVCVPNDAQSERWGLLQRATLQNSRRDTRPKDDRSIGRATRSGRAAETEGDAMSLDEYRGAVWAFAELMKRPRADVAPRRDLGGKPARGVSQRATSRKIHIGLFA